VVSLFNTVLHVKPENSVIRSGSAALTESELQSRHRQFLSAATSENTRRAYRSAIRHFQMWGGILPCESALVIRYLLTYAEVHNVRNLALRLTALSQWHQF